MIDFDKIIDGIEMIEFFNQRAGRELWMDKPKDIQEEDLKKENEILNAARDALLICSYVGEEELAAAEKRRKDAQREYDKKLEEEVYRESIIKGINKSFAKIDIIDNRFIGYNKNNEEIFSFDYSNGCYEDILTLDPQPVEENSL